MKKILYISNVRLPTEKAHGLQIMETCSALAERGVDLTLVVPRRVNPIKDGIFKYYSKEKNFAVKKNFSLDLMFLPLFKSVTFAIQSLSFALASIFFVLFRRSNEIIYTRDFMIALVMILCSRPLFYEIHNVSEKNMWLHRFIWDRVIGLIVISNGLKNDLVKLVVDEKRILVAPDGVDIKRFDVGVSQQAARAKLELESDKKIIVYAGHLYEWKGADLVARAAEKLSNFKFYLVGGNAEDVEKFKKKYDYRNLHIIGHRKPDEIPLWLKSADFLVLPNSKKEKISFKYTSPLKLFEYIASGTPVIASDLPSLREVLSEKTAIFFKSDDVDDFIDKVNKYMVSYAEAQEKADCARQVAEEYTWDERAQKILRFIHAD